MANKQSKNSRKSGSILLRMHRSQKWIALAAMTMGSVMQISNCRSDVALFGLRTAYSSITLPINTLIRDIIFSFAGLI